MSGFSADWLALREPMTCARATAAVLEAVVASLKNIRPLRVVDLACGTGSTLRALGPYLPAQQNWRLCDNDLGLLARAAATPCAAGVTVTTLPARSQPRSRSRARWPGRSRHHVGAARSGLRSHGWNVLRSRSRRARSRSTRRSATTAASNSPRPIRSMPRSSKRSMRISAPTKALGRRSGRRRHRRAIARFEALGYAVVHGRSDWVAGPQDRDIQLEILGGWAAAARELGDVPLAATVEWLTRRRDAVAAGRSSIRVGHVDFFAAPTGTR